MAEHRLPRPPAGTPPLYAQDGKGYDAVVHAHYFIGSNDWLVTEYDPAEDVAFGWACLNGDRANAELGYTSLAELEQVLVHAFMLVDCEDPWEPVPLHAAIALLDRRQGRREE